MPDLVSAAQFKAITPVSLADRDLDAVIERIEAEITAKIGAPYSAGLEITETLPGIGGELFLKRPVSAMVSVTEYDSWITAEATSESLTQDDDYILWADQGVLQRINGRSTWDVKTVVVYTPKDDRDQRRQVIIDLVRVDLARSPFKSESVGGAYSYSAPDDWERVRNRILNRIMFTRI